MNKQSVSRTPQAVTTELSVSSATLRRWSDEFADYLSQDASSPQERSHRRYTDDDVATLKFIKELMHNGMTYEQTRQQLADQFVTWSDQPGQPIRKGLDDDDEGGDSRVPERDEEMGLIASNGNESAVLAFFTNTLATLSENQKSVLNSQAANRELLGVLIQDNFNLKEENNRLRERILDVERNLAQIRQEDEWRRESLRQELDAKITQVQQMASEAMSTAYASQESPEIKAVKTKSGCLGALFGGGDNVQIVAVPHRRGRKQGAGAKTGPAPPPPSTYPPSTPPHQPTPPLHPKPTAPPE